MTWESHLHALKAYKFREGDTQVPWHHVEKELLLGAWLSLQWREQRSGRLSSQRSQWLADAGVAWGRHTPLVRGVVPPDFHNDRKWDERRGYELASRRVAHVTDKQGARPFDERCWERHWQPYNAATDVHTIEWRKRVTAHTPALKRPATTL